MLAYELVDRNINYIYKNTYWGQTEVNSKNIRTLTSYDIISNRNEFVYEYEIKSYLNNDSDIFSFESYGKNSHFSNFFDNIEIYLNNLEEYVLITSPTNLNTSYYQEFRFMEKFKFKKIYNLYSTEGKSYVKVGNLLDFSFQLEDFNSIIV